MSWFNVDLHETSSPVISDILHEWDIILRVTLSMMST